jgi:predicted phage-related endonuclease
VTLLPIPADPAAWHALRAQHIGASEVATLFGVAPDYMPGIFALWHVKAGRVPREDIGNQRMRWGLLLEDAIAAGAAEMEGWEVLPGLYASRDGLGATLDRRIAAPGPNDAGCTGPGVLELKNADWLMHKRSWGDEPPMHILLQLQAQLLTTGCTWGAVAVLIGGNDLRIYRYQARPRLQAEIAARVASFWASVKADQPPQPDGSDATYRALMALMPDADKQPIDLSEDNEVPSLCAAYLHAGADERAAKARKDEARNRLLEKLAGHEWAHLTGFRLTQAIVAAKPPRPAAPGEIISGRAESRRITVKELSQ